MKTAISLPDSLFKSISRTTNRLHMSRSAFFAAAASRYLHEVQRDNVTERLNAIYRENQPLDSRLPESISLMQSATIKRDKW